MKTVIVLGMHGTPPSDFPRDEMAEFFGGAHHHDEHDGHDGNDGHGGHEESAAPGTHPHLHNGQDGHSARNAHPEQEALRRQQQRKRKAELSAKMRAWPRTPANDPFHAGSFELAEYLSQASGHDVVVGFNEFCDPTIEDALDQAVALGADKIVVITPMMTRGGEHSESDIPGAVQRSQARHPGTQMVYAWPFEITSVAQFLAAQVERFAQ
jgi:sirohydrochlorin cobaltochelatase